MARAKAGPVVTDNGNFIVDAPFSEAAMKKPREVRYTYSAQGRPLIRDQLLVNIKLLTGVVEVGLFCGVVRAAYFGNQVRICVSTTVAAVLTGT